MPRGKPRGKATAAGAAERPAFRHNYQEVFETHFVELKPEALLSECWFGDNPRGDENDGEAVKASYAQHGKLRDEPAMLWAKLPTKRPSHYEHVPKHFKYTCIDGHGREAFYSSAHQFGCVLRQKDVAPGDRMFLTHNANILDENLSLEEITTLAVAKISVNDSGSKTRTCFQDYSMFKWNILAFQKVTKRKLKSTDLLAQYQSTEFDQRFFTRLLKIVEYLQDKTKTEEIIRKCCNVLGKGCCLNFDSLYSNKELERLSVAQQLQVFEECLKSLPFVENTQGGGVRKIVDTKKLKLAEGAPKPTRIITSPRSFTDCCTAFWMRSITMAHIHSMGGKVVDSEKSTQWLNSLNQGKHDSILLGEADNIKAPTAVNTGRLCGKEDFYMKKAVKKYIDHCRWKETSEVADKSEDEDRENSEVENNGESDIEQEEMEQDDFALTDEEDEVRDARLLRKEQLREVQAFEARAAELTMAQKRNQEFKDERDNMEAIAAELEKSRAQDSEAEEKLKAKMEEKAAEVLAEKLARAKARASEPAVSEEDEEVPQPPLDLSNVTAERVFPTGTVLRNGKEPDFDEAQMEELYGFIALRYSSLEYEKDYEVYVEVRSSADITKEAKGGKKQKKARPDPKIMFRLRKHKLAGAVQDPIVLTSRAVLGAGIPLLTLVLGTYEEIAKDLHPTLLEGVGVAAIITDVPWGDEKDTGYNTTVDWGAALRAISTVFDLNAALPDESKKQDLGKTDGEGIVFAMGDITALNTINQEALKNRFKVYKNMPGFVLLDGVRQSEVRGNTPSASGHLYTTFTRALNKPKLDYRKAVLLKFGPEHENICQVQTLTNFFCGNVLGPLSITELENLEMVLEKNVKEFGAKEQWSKDKINEMVQTLCEKAKVRFSEYGDSFQALHSSGTFKHNCQVSGCAALKGKCNENGKTLVVGQKSVELGEYLVERYTSAAGQVVMDPFMGSGSGGVAALRKGRCFIGYEQKETNYFSAVFHLSCALQKMIEGDEVYVVMKYQTP
ncbi:hypothetical protein CYMTET_55414 [Cymbomonas tetramitiformis]|uniref:DNA methylase N-4/N-6 domain-containing protein n=1 Tax=Cymbomonas tetramitiformis TaxID=36881 RepID=A0AAE0BCZ2_9CHLO|nr:hypothetical protein CYMTET_55414 [Cymbomonas tetramitiformis]